MSRRPVLLMATALLLGACATAPVPLRGDYAALTPEQASRSQALGEQVRWGGSIVGVDPRQDSTCFEVLGRPLGGNARPLRTDLGNGRFLACRAGFYDPAIFAEDREMTVVGRIGGIEQRPVGGYAYAYPRVDAEVVFLWPERADREVYFVGPVGWHQPYWGGYRMRHYHPVRHVVRPPRRSGN